MLGRQHDSRAEAGSRRHLPDAPGAEDRARERGRRPGRATGRGRQHSTGGRRRARVGDRGDRSVRLSHEGDGLRRPNTIGLLAKQTKLRENQLFVLPRDAPYSLRQWAAFSVRYLSAWANWRVAYGCWRVQMPADLMPTPHVFAWGGGVALAQLTLAKSFGCHVFMAASSDYRLQLIEQSGIVPIDRRQFPHLNFEAERYETDRRYKRDYLASESTFVGLIRSHTENLGASIVIDNIGRPVFRASLRALARQGVLATQGWKLGPDLTLNRAAECVNRHIHVSTHASSFAEAVAGTHFALETGWLPRDVDDVYAWEDVSQLACDVEHGRVRSYFPLFAVNPD